MTLEVYIAYLVACAILLFIPGPTILLVISYAISHGRSSAFATIFGVMAGDLVAVFLSMLGLGALLMTSAGLFTAMKWLGAAYLVYLGIKMWRAPSAGESYSEGAGDRERVAPDPTSKRAMALDAFTVTVLNPKSGMFLVAFLPQFMDAAKPLLPQTLVLGSTFMVLAFASVTLYALLASELRRLFRSPWFFSVVNKLGGASLVGAGVLTAAMKRA